MPGSYLAADLLDINGLLDVKFVFVQAKTSSNFSGEQIMTFVGGFDEFFLRQQFLTLRIGATARGEVIGLTAGVVISTPVGRPNPRQRHFGRFRCVILGDMTPESPTDAGSNRGHCAEGSAAVHWTDPKLVASTLMFPFANHFAGSVAR